MDRYRLDSLTQSFAAPSRRGIVHALARGGLAAIVGWPLGVSVEARTNHHKKRKKKKKTSLPQQPPFNQFGCLDAGQPCQGDSTLCCSGICEGVKPQKGQSDTSVCVGHNAGICGPDSNACLAEVPCNSSNPNCRCALTTGSTGFCADLTPFFLDPVGGCRDCSHDTDCQAEFGPGAACIVFGRACPLACPGTSGKTCVPACA